MLKSGQGIKIVRTILSFFLPSEQLKCLILEIWSNSHTSENFQSENDEY